MTAPPIPGWYRDPDPAHPTMLRWWSGSQWTTHQVPAPPVAGRPGRPAPPRRIPERAGRNSGFGRLTMLASAVVTAITLPLLSYVAAMALRDLFGYLDAVGDAAQRGATPPALPGSIITFIVVTVLAGPLTWGVLVMLMTWSYRASTAAAALGIAAKHDSMWAVLGWLIPILSYWYPYQVVRDCLPADHPTRPVVIRWWVGYLVSTNGLLYLVPAALIGTTTFMVAAGVHLVITVLADSTGARIATAIDQAHQELLSQRAQAQPAPEPAAAP